MRKYTLAIPYSTADFKLKVKDQLTIIVTADCTWSFLGSPAMFDPPLLPPGTYIATQPPTKYGPYTAVEPGALEYFADPLARHPQPHHPLTGHSIVVS